MFRSLVSGPACSGVGLYGLACGACGTWKGGCECILGDTKPTALKGLYLAGVGVGCTDLLVKTGMRV